MGTLVKVDKLSSLLILNFKQVIFAILLVKYCIGMADSADTDSFVGDFYMKLVCMCHPAFKTRPVCI